MNAEYFEWDEDKNNFVSVTRHGEWFMAPRLMFLCMEAYDILVYSND